MDVYYIARENFTSFRPKCENINVRTTKVNIFFNFATVFFLLVNIDEAQSGKKWCDEVAIRQKNYLFHFGKLSTATLWFL